MSRRKRGDYKNFAVDSVKRRPVDDRAKCTIPPRLRPEDQEGVLWKAEDVQRHLV